MSTLKEKILGIVPGADDAEIATAYSAADADRQIVAKVHGNVERNSKIVNDLRQQVRDAALAVEMGGSDTGLKKLKGQLIPATDALEQSENALVSAQQKADASERALNTARGAGDLRRIKRIVNERRKRAEAFSEAANAYVSTGLALLKANAKIVQGWPLANPAPRGALLYDDEMAEEIGYFLASLNPHDSLSAAPRMPGSVFTSFRNSFEEIPLIQKVQQADDFIVRSAGPK
jgi:hypothetical protein